MDDGESLEAIFRGSSPARRESLSDEVLDRFREAIVRGDLEPGHRLSEPALAEAFGVSRGPIREALARLQQEGLVQSERHRGARVARMSREDLEELYELRVDLECLAAKRAVRLIGSRELEAMSSVISDYKRAVEGHAVEEAVDLDMRFHDLIYQAARHEQLYKCWSSLLRSRIHAFVLSRSAADPGYMTPCISEHAAIRDAIEARDRDRAIELVTEHLSSACERLLQVPVEEDS